MSEQLEKLDEKEVLQTIEKSRWFNAIEKLRGRNMDYINKRIAKAIVSRFGRPKVSPDDRAKLRKEIVTEILARFPKEPKLYKLKVKGKVNDAYATSFYNEARAQCRRAVTGGGDNYEK